MLHARALRYNMPGHLLLCSMAMILLHSWALRCYMPWPQGVRFYGTDIHARAQSCGTVMLHTMSIRCYMSGHSDDIKGHCDVKCQDTELLHASY